MLSLLRIKSMYLIVESACRGGIMDSGCDIFCTQPANHTAKAQSQILR